MRGRYIHYGLHTVFCSAVGQRAAAGVQRRDSSHAPQSHLDLGRLPVGRDTWAEAWRGTVGGRDIFRAGRLRANEGSKSGSAGVQHKSSIKGK